MLKIMIIEDEAFIAIQIKTYLSRKGLDIVGYAANFNEAYELFERHKPEIIICDIRLQNDESGIDIVKELQKIGIFEVLYLSSFSDQKTLEKAFATHPFNYITKPFKDIDIYTSMQLCISKLKEQDENRLYHYDPDTRTLYHFNELISLTRQEADLFHLCYLNKGHYVPMSLIEYTLWNDKEVIQSTRRGLFYRLAKKVGKDIFKCHSLHGCRVML